MKTSGNTVLITGGSSGIGLALAQRFLELNNQVIITGRDAQKLEAIRQKHPQMGIFAGDLTLTATQKALVAWLEANYPTLNILVNNAAVQYNYLFTDETDQSQQISYEIATNLTAPIILTHSLLPLLRKNPQSAVVNVSSGLFLSPKKSASVYCATKAAIHSFSCTLRYQLEEQGMRVFEIIPSLVDTPMTQGRGKNKITSEALVDEFLDCFQRDRFEIYIGKAKLLKWLHRFIPSVASRLLKNS